VLSREEFGLVVRNAPLVSIATAARLPEEQHSRYRWASVEEILGDPAVHENTKAYCRA
jgi:hypothetical protein